MASLSTNYQYPFKHEKTKFGPNKLGIYSIVLWYFSLRVLKTTVSVAPCLSLSLTTKNNTQQEKVLRGRRTGSLFGTALCGSTGVADRAAPRVWLKGPGQSRT
eukprot:GEMP01157633.1.p2 GENE.GEMP01157633.1~~GEMP01157633.1.p2  ORF type:complete len:103 (-),score=8.68 GEMP01157633.1:40-348(-)